MFNEARWILNDPILKSKSCLFRVTVNFMNIFFHNFGIVVEWSKKPFYKLCFCDVFRSFAISLHLRVCVSCEMFGGCKITIRFAVFTILTYMNRIRKIHIHSLFTWTFLGFCFIFRMKYFPCDFPFWSSLAVLFCVCSTKHFAWLGLKKGFETMLISTNVYIKTKKMHVNEALPSKNQIKNTHTEKWNCEFSHLSIDCFITHCPRQANK